MSLPLLSLLHPVFQAPAGEHEYEIVSVSYGA